ncbi:MAG: class I SAM-dependent methyltransferase [Patescibacteria group bacterium]
METGEKTLEIMSSAVWYNNWLLKQISTYLRGEILEVGAGIGNFTSKLSKYGKVTAIDYDSSYKNANYGDIEKGKYFFGKRTFDTIVCMNVLEHIKNDKKALKNMYELLNIGGKLILLVPAHNWAYGQIDKELGHFRRYSKKSVSDLLIANGYSLMVIRHLNWLGLLGWFINGKVLKKRIISQGQLNFFDKIAKLFLFVEKFVRPPFGLSVLVIGEKK